MFPDYDAFLRMFQDKGYRAAIFELDNGSLGFEDTDWGEIVEVFCNGKFLGQGTGW